MLRAPRSAVLVILGLVLSYGTTARAQNAAAPAFSLENFRPAVDSKGYVTVNASQILGHLDFSLGLVGSFAHNVLNLTGQGNALRRRATTSRRSCSSPSACSSGSSSACRCRSTSCSARARRSSPIRPNPNDNNDLIVLRAVHRRHRLPPQGALPQHLEVSGRARHALLGVRAVGRRKEVPRRRPGDAAARAHRRQGVRLLAPLQDGAQRRRAHPPVGALVHRPGHDADARGPQRRQRVLPAGAARGGCRCRAT